MNISIDPVLNETDARTVSDLARITWNETYSNLISEEQIEYMLLNFQSADAISERIANDEKYYIVRSDGREAGYFCIVCEFDRLFLSKIYVRSEFQRKGIATRILEFVKTVCRTSGRGLIYLTVNRGNKNAIAFYESAGFAVARNVIKDIGNGFVMDDHIMELAV